ncbi:5'/3'-nucleotidase SurE [Novosphingobium umbonatum]|uniref:5'-nucleotidase SurE n=1 Tax=Novosphingobium umbonatum TaxID=1908524 RepID=A0A437NAC0_9SPHN|nr:5'/3'-nucleotidase SurE [Novosphingobium umbonatum]RVU06871.1 5'/3'-nucleotidase SurE [Novosphingobium umbonatum]
MRILLTNDDGINAPGLAVLESIAASLSDDIWVVAPAEEQSGAGHSLTLNRPVRLHQHGERRFSVSGTPTDAVTMGLKKVLPAPPDLILSGVNRGANLGDDVTYSGTVSAAMEGALAGIKSIALSQIYNREGMGDQVSFAAALAWGEKVIRPLLEFDLPKRSLININFPDIVPQDIKGIKVVRQGFHDYSRGSVVEGTDPRGYRYFWFGLHGIEHTLGHNTDLEAIADGYISVSPLHLDLTHEASLSTLSEKFNA